MKKYVFTLSVTAFIAALLFAPWWLASAIFASIFVWLAVETRRRDLPRFFRGAALIEHGFRFDTEALQFELAADGRCAAMIGRDAELRVWSSEGKLLWRRPAEPNTLALLPYGQGCCYAAIADELLHYDGSGHVVGRLPFPAAPFHQSYHLQWAPDADCLMLHTPWFLQFADARLTQLGQRIRCEETGHYIKHAAMSPAADLVFFGGAKLLDEGQGTEARWACWTRSEGSWKESWSHREEANTNSHLRQVVLSADASTLMVELYREGYEFRIFEREGALRWKRAGEHPQLSVDGSTVLWLNRYEGLTLSQSGGKLSQVLRRSEEEPRFRMLLDPKSCLLFEKGRLLCLSSAGEERHVGDEQYKVDRFLSSRDGQTFAVLGSSRASILRVRP